MTEIWVVFFFGIVPLFSLLAPANKQAYAESAPLWEERRHHLFPLSAL